MSKVDNFCDEAMGLLERFVATERETEEDSEDNINNMDERTITNLTDCMKYFATAKLRREAAESLFRRTMEDIEKVDSAEEAAELIESYNKELKKLSKFSINSDVRYNNFTQSLEQGDEDIKTVKSTRSLIDPISKVQMVDPVKNKACGHSYEKSVVLQLIAKNPKTRCPMMGCTASVIKKSDLVPDLELKRILETKANRRDSTILEDSNIVSLDQTT